MKTMRVYYLNDTAKPVQVYTVDLSGIPVLLNKFGAGQVFEFEAPEDSIPFIKAWDNGTVLISYTMGH